MGLIASLFGYVLAFWYHICQNYGIAIILFALTIKIIMIPLTIKQQKSLKKSQEMQPKLLELQERYQDNQEAMMIEYQKLMSENKFNPFGGCLISFLQIPILLGVLYVVGSPLTYMEKMDEAHINEYIQPLIIEESYQGDADAFAAEYPTEEAVEEAISTYKQTHRYYELLIVKEHQIYNMDFFGINLGDVAAEHQGNYTLLIIPILTTVFFYLSLYVASSHTKQASIKTPDGEEITMPSMMAMNFVMPLMSGYISYVVPQGMGLYWFINSLFQIIVQVTMMISNQRKTSPDVIEVKKSKKNEKKG